MKVIDSYLETLFAEYPQTSRFKQARIELQRMMEDHVEDLIEEGLSETQALGKVIAEFGSLDEVAEELDLGAEIAEYRNAETRLPASKPEMTLDRVKAYADTVRSRAPQRAIGVSLFILAPAFLMFCMAFGETRTTKILSFNFESVMLAVGLVGLLILVVGGVLVSRNAALPLNKFSEVELENYYLSPDTVGWIQQETLDQKAQNALLQGIAISLFIVSAAAVIVPSVLNSSGSAILAGAGVLLVLVAIGV